MLFILMPDESVVNEWRELNIIHGFPILLILLSLYTYFGFMLIIGHIIIMTIHIYRIKIHRNLLELKRLIKMNEILSLCCTSELKYFNKLIFKREFCDCWKYFNTLPWVNSFTYFGSDSVELVRKSQTKYLKSSFFCVVVNIFSLARVISALITPHRFSITESFFFRY